MLQPTPYFVPRLQDYVQFHQFHIPKLPFNFPSLNSSITLKLTRNEIRLAYVSSCSEFLFMNSMNIKTFNDNDSDSTELLIRSSE